jgi:hypothetical protein
MAVSLNKWFYMMSMHPWHSYQLANSLVPIESKCNAIIFERSWQGAERAGRADIRRAIQAAEDMFANVTNYRPRATFRDVVVPWPVMGDYRLANYTNFDTRGNWMGLTLPDGYVQALGYEHITTSVSSNLTYTDEDGDGIYETATATATVPTGTTAAEVYCTFSAGDYLYNDGIAIDPRTVSVVGTVATVKFDAWTLVRPILYTVARPSVLDPSVMPPTATSPYAKTVQIARRYCDGTGTTIDTAQAVMIWESAPYPYWAVPCSGNNYAPDPSAVAYAIARCGVRDNRAGIVYAGESIYNATNNTWSGRVGFQECRPPDRVRLRYLAGRDEEYIDVAIARLAAAVMARRICACESATKEVAEWQIDYSRTGATTETYAQPTDLTNPFGTRKGHVYAWRIAQQTQRLTGILAG